MQSNTLQPYDATAYKFVLAWSDRLPMPKRRGFSGDACGNPLPERLKGLPGPTRTVPASPGERGSKQPDSSAWHHV